MKVWAGIRPVLALSLGWVVNVVVWTLFVLFSVLTWRRFTDQVYPPMVRKWASCIMRILGVRIEAQGQEHIIERRPRIVVVNHQSSLDLIWPAIFFSPGSFAIGKKELAFVPFFNLMWWSAGCKFIDRRKAGKAARQIKEFASDIREKGKSLYIAPEGTRTLDGSILSFKRGAFYIALDAKVPIYPVVSDGGHLLLPKHSLFPRPGLIKVSYLPPIDTSDWTLENLSEKVEKVRQIMVEELDRMRGTS